MALIPWRNKKTNATDAETALVSPVTRLRDEMDRLLDRFLDRPWDLGADLLAGVRGWAPALEMEESDKDVTVRAEVAGVEPKDLDISMTGNLLTISGEKKESKDEKHGGYAYSERCFGSFRRTIQLPSSVDPEKVTAEHKNGVLVIRMQKLESATPRRIPVRAGK